MTFKIISNIIHLNCILKEYKKFMKKEKKIIINDIAYIYWRLIYIYVYRQKLIENHLDLDYSVKCISKNKIKN